MTILEFESRFPTEEACLYYVFQSRYGDMPDFEKYRKIPGRKKYYYKSHHISPLADTIFHKSSTPLRLWFYAIFLFSNSTHGVSAAELQRQLGVTYKTAWRMANLIRTKFASAPLRLSGVVEMDETYFNDQQTPHYKHRKTQIPVIGMRQRQGGLVVSVEDSNSATNIQRLWRRHLAKGSTLYTDGWNGYDRAKRHGYGHHTVNHSKFQWADGEVSTNGLEGFWGRLKRSIYATHYGVSYRHLQSYVDEHVWKANFSSSVDPCAHLLSKAVQCVSGDRGSS